MNLGFSAHSCLIFDFLISQPSSGTFDTSCQMSSYPFLPLLVNAILLAQSLLPPYLDYCCTVSSCYSLVPKPQWVSPGSLPGALTRLALATYLYGCRLPTLSFTHSTPSTTSLLRDVARKFLPQALCTLSSLTWECSFSRYSHGLVSYII